MKPTIEITTTLKLGITIEQDDVSATQWVKLLEAAEKGKAMGDTYRELLLSLLDDEHGLTEVSELLNNDDDAFSTVQAKLLNHTPKKHNHG